MKVVIDTNILFSALLSESNKFSDLIFKNPQIQFFAPKFILEELNSLETKLEKYTSLNKTKRNQLSEKLFQNITLIDPDLVKKILGKKHITSAKMLTKMIHLL